MSRFRLGGLPGILWLALALPMFAACTGTEEDTLPTLLIVGTVAGDGPQLILVEDVFEPDAVPPRDLRPVAGSETALAVPPVSFDVVDRNGSRSELVVLGHEQDESWLYFFDISDLDPANPGPLPTSRPPLDLKAIAELEPTVAAPLCPVEVAVGGGGRYAALLDDGSCRNQGPELYLIDLEAAELVFSLSAEEPSAWTDLLPVGIFVDQVADLLYFATGSLDLVEIRTVPLAGASATTPVGSARVRAVPGVSGDLERLGDAIGLLADDALALVPTANGSETPVDTLATLDGATMVLPDPTGTLTELVVLSPNEVAIHEHPEDDDPEVKALTATAVSAALEPVQRFAYLLQEGGISILDLIARDSEPRYHLDFRPVTGLEDPRVITWTYAGEADSPP